MSKKKTQLFPHPSSHKTFTAHTPCLVYYTHRPPKLPHTTATSWPRGHGSSMTHPPMYTTPNVPLTLSWTSLLKVTECATFSCVLGRVVWLIQVRFFYITKGVMNCLPFNRIFNSDWRKCTFNKLDLHRVYSKLIILIYKWHNTFQF